MSEKTRILPELTPPFRLPFVMARLLEEVAQAGIELEDEANHDELTGALNRRGFKAYFESANAPKALLLIDATNFKAVNDEFDYIEGDLLLKSIYTLLQESVRPTDKIARWGGDEFIIALNGDNQEQVQATGDIKNNRVNKTHVEYIVLAKERVAYKVREFLAKPEHIKFISVNFDLAVGGTEWLVNTDLDDLIEKLKIDMDVQKYEQHKNGQYRSS